MYELVSLFCVGGGESVECVNFSEKFGVDRVDLYLGAMLGVVHAILNSKKEVMHLYLKVKWIHYDIIFRAVNKPMTDK